MKTFSNPNRAVASRRRRLWRWALGLLLAYAGIGFLILPPIIRTVAVKQLSQLLGREVSIAKVRVNPFALSGSIQGFLVKDLDGEPLLSWDEAYANFQLSSFLGRPWVFKEVMTTNPYVRVQVNPDFTFNFSDIINRFATNPSPAAAKPARPLALRVESLRIQGARASLTDRTLRRPFTRVIGPVELDLENFHTDPSSKNPYAFAGSTDAGETFSWSGHFFLDPLRSGGELKVGNVALPRFAPLFQDLLRFEVRDGVVDLAAKYQFVLSPTTNVVVVTNATFRLSALKVADPAVDGNVLELAAAAVTNASVDLFNRRGEIESVFASGAQLWVRRNSNAAINLIELAQPAPEATNAPGSVMLLMQAVTNGFASFFASTNLWAATVHAVDVTDCALDLEDLALPRPVQLRLDDIALHARQLSNLPGSNLTAEVSLRWNTNGTVKTEVRATLAPPAVDLKLDVNQLTLAPLDPYLAGFVNLFVLDSRASLAATTTLRFAPDGQPLVHFNGSARLDGFSTVDGVFTNELLRWDSVRVNDIAAQLVPPEISLGRIEVLGLAARVAVETNQAINVLSALRLNSTNRPVTAPVVPAPARKSSFAAIKKELFGTLAATATGTNTGGLNGLPKVTLNSLAISNAALQFIDQSQPAVVRFGVHDVSGEVTGISTADLRRGDLVLGGRVDRAGKFNFKGALNLLNPDLPTQLELSVADVNLTPASPYAGRLLGYQLSRGSVGVNVKYDLTGRRLKGANLIALDQFTLGSKVDSPDAVKLPIKLGLALLKDRNGRIELDVPIEGDFSDPEFRLSRVIWRVIGNVITKAATSPFSALGSLLGGKAEEASYVDFAPGSSELSTNAAVKLTALARALYERPGLELDIAGGFTPAADRDALARKKLLQRFRDLKWQSLRKSAQEQMSVDRLTLTVDEYAGYLRAAYAAAASAGRLPTNAPAAAPANSSNNRTLQDKGAASLAAGAAQAEAGLGLAQMERQLLATIPVAELELQKLATSRARRVQDYLAEVGKVEAPRLFVINGTESVTNRLARVDLRLK